MNKYIIRKTGAIGLLCGLILITGCAHTTKPTSESTLVPALQVDSFASLRDACKSTESIAIKLTQDITATKDLKILSSDDQKREVTLDLNGYTLFFEKKKSMRIFENEDMIKTQEKFTLTSGRKGSSVIFMYEPEEDVPGGISNGATFVLDGDVIVTAKNAVAMSSPMQAEHWSYQYSALIDTGSSESLFIMNSGTINAPGNYRHAINSDSDGQVIINGGVIQGIGEDSIAVYNWGGKFRMNGGEIHVSGKGCVAISNEDDFQPLAPPVGAKEPPKIIPERDTFVMTGGTVSAAGKNAVAVTTEKNCKVFGGVISAAGQKSIGIAYYFNGVNKKDKQYINLIGGQISGEGCALVNKGSHNTFYRNANDERVNVNSAVKEIKLG